MILFNKQLLFLRIAFAKYVFDNCKMNDKISYFEGTPPGFTGIVTIPIATSMIADTHLPLLLFSRRSALFLLEETDNILIRILKIISFSRCLKNLPMVT